jgi:predicted GNAT family acetyltransferase
MATNITREEDDHGKGRYVLTVDGVEAGELVYRMHDDRRVLIHTGVEEAFEGQGLAGQLARRALDDARDEGTKIVPQCPFVRSYLERHPDDQPLVDAELTAQLVQ